MAQSQHDSLQVDVPVGFLLSEMREILVSVDRPYDVPLAIKLRLVPADSGLAPALIATPSAPGTEGPPSSRRLARRRSAEAADAHDFGGCD